MHVCDIRNEQQGEVQAVRVSPGLVRSGFNEDGECDPAVHHARCRHPVPRSNRKPGQRKSARGSQALESVRVRPFQAGVYSKVVTFLNIG